MPISSSAKNSRKHIALPSLLFCAFGIMLATYEFCDIVEAYSARNWPTIGGEVTSVETSWRKGARGSVCFFPLVYFKYSTVTSSYISSTRKLKPECLSKVEAENLSRRYEAGGTVVVHYNPDHPGRSVLELGGPFTSDWVGLACGIAMTALAFIFYCGLLDKWLVWPKQNYSVDESRFKRAIQLLKTRARKNDKNARNGLL